MQPAQRLWLFPFVFCFVPSLFAQDEATRRDIKRIVEEIEIVPSLYAKEGESTQIKALPKFSAKKLQELALDKEDVFSRQRERYRTKKDRYVKDYPLRAAIFEAAEEVEKINKAELPLVFLLPKPDKKDKTKDKSLAKAKVTVLQRQSYLGSMCFKLEQVLARLSEVKIEQEKSKHWQADAHFARARLEQNLIFLYELNFSLGQIRADALPELAAGDVGWRIAFKPKVTVPEGKVKTMAKECLKRLEKMQEDYAETPWAFFAERDRKREWGMEWRTTK
jgi:hypothetical protein